MTATTANIDMITMHAWEAWTNNGLHLDGEGKRKTERLVQDVVKTVYYDGIDNLEWLDTAVRWLHANDIIGGGSA
jgi:hypothetical protein